MKRAIITGPTGSVGTALIKELISHKIEVLAITRKDSKRNANIIADDLVSIKYCSIDELESLQNDTGKEYDVFYHFAWEGTTGASRNDMYMQNRNVKHALDAVEVAKRFGCKTFIGAGSQAEYGRVEGLLKPETLANPEMGYGYAKLCAGLMTREHAHQLGLNHIWVRILSIYGPNDGAQSMVMSTINKLKNNEVAQFTKGEQMWDYLYSGDAAKAFYLLGKESLINSSIDGKTYVLGSGNARPLADYINEIKEVVNPEGQIDLGAIPYSDKQVMYLCADIQELVKDINFKPEMSFKDGIKSIMSI